MYLKDSRQVKIEDFDYLSMTKPDNPNIDDQYLVPLSFPLQSLIKQKHVDACYREAATFPDGSRERRAFIAYAESLKSRLAEQNRIDSKK